MDRTFDGAFEPPRLDGLHEVVGRAEIDGAESRVDRWIARDEHDGHIQTTITQELEQLHAGEVRHLDVAHDAIECLAAQYGDRFEPAHRYGSRVTRSCERPGDRAPYGGIVVDHQHPEGFPEGGVRRLVRGQASNEYQEQERIVSVFVAPPEMASGSHAERQSGRDCCLSPGGQRKGGGPSEQLRGSRSSTPAPTSTCPAPASRPRRNAT